MKEEVYGVKICCDCDLDTESEEKNRTMERDNG